MKNQKLLALLLAPVVGLALTNCSHTTPPTAANIIYGSPSGGPIPIYVLATYRDLKAGGLSAGWLRGWNQAEFEFLRLDSSRRICGTGQTPTCRREVPIALVAVPKSYLTGEIPGSLALYHIMSGTGDLIGGAGNLLSGVAWFRGIKVNFSGEPLAVASANAQGGSSRATGGSASAASSSEASSKSSSRSHSESSSYSSGDKHFGGHHGGHHGGGKPGDKGGMGGMKKD
jgi:hypothetical protein